MDVAVGTGNDFNPAETSLLVEEVLIFDLAEDEAGRGLAARGDEILKPAGLDEGEQAPEEEGFARLGELERLDGKELAEEGSQTFTGSGCDEVDALILAFLMQPEMTPLAYLPVASTMMRRGCQRLARAEISE